MPRPDNTATKGIATAGPTMTAMLVDEVFSDELEVGEDLSTGVEVEVPSSYLCVLQNA
jgi:hypothetical protein